MKEITESIAPRKTIKKASQDAKTNCDLLYNIEPPFVLIPEKKRQYDECLRLMNQYAGRVEGTVCGFFQR
ncbi:MAG: hypothetical protein IJX80_04110 [Clostridia bacterium]|nr:hypothetical protein [Clostridia bacterium]